MKIYSFEPLINDKCKILILGSMPSMDSLRKNEYYGNTRNSFWHIIFELLEQDLTQNYEIKKQTLLDNYIALWDVVADCTRDGSLDSAIKDAKSNDFQSLYEKYTNIQHVFFNGAKAYDIYKRKMGIDKKKRYYRLPSTSSAYAINYEKKLIDWSIVKDIVKKI